MIFLLGKRKSLLQAKKKKVRDDVDARLHEARMAQQQDLGEFAFSKDRDFLKIT